MSTDLRLPSEAVGRFLSIVLLRGRIAENLVGTGEPVPGQAT